MAEKVEDEKLPTESVTASWIQLDAKNGSSTTEESPNYSDNDSNEDNMTEALADASRSLYNSTIESSGEQTTVLSDSSASTPKSTTSNLLYVSTLLLSHSLALIIGVVIGRKVLSSNR